MNTLQELIKAMQKQNEQIQNSFGLKSLQRLAKAISEQSKLQNNLTGLSGLTDIAKSLSHQMKPFNASSAVLGNSLTAQMNAMQYPKNQNALLGLTSTLAEIAKTNQKLSDNLSGFASSQLFLSSNLAEIAKSLSQTHLDKFNGIDVALRGISKAYLRNVTINRAWDDIKVAEEVNETIANASDDLLSQNKQVTIQDLDNLKQSIVLELYGLLGKTKTEKAKQFIFELITIISFLLTLYSFHKEQSDLSNQDVIEQTRSDIKQMNKELSMKIETELQKLKQIRIARTNVNLRYADKKNSKIIGLVKKGQRVTVIEIRHKYILISYIDAETGEPKSGFVVKKYFEKEK
jgi:hypothetical protein